MGTPEQSSESTRPPLSWSIAFVVAGLVVVGAHLYRLDRVPQGIFIDESSVGLNAAAIADGGRDEYGVSFPVYFQSFGDYKSPVYIYLAALIFKVLGVSTWTLRFTSALFLLAAVAAVFLLVRRLFPARPFIALYVILALGFLPHYFNLSRVSFEFISQIGLVCWALYLAHVSFPDARPARPWLAAATGLVLGLSTYAYATSRLLSPLLMALMLAVYFHRTRRRALAALAGVWTATLIPLVLFIRAHPKALTLRFKDVSYLADPQMSAGAKVAEFVRQYSDYWTLRFLVFRGDANPRHTTGWGGLLFGTVLVLAVAGIVMTLVEPGVRKRPTVRLLLGLLLVAPSAAALTSEGAPHSLRAGLESIPLVLFSCIGIDVWMSKRGRRGRVVLAACVLLTLSAEIGAYLRHYFTRYPAISAPFFETDGMAEMLAAAIARHPRHIYVTGGGGAALANWSSLRFLRRALHVPPDFDISTGFPPPGVTDTCVVYYWGWTPPDGGYRWESPPLGARLYCTP